MVRQDTLAAKIAGLAGFGVRGVVGDDSNRWYVTHQSDDDFAPSDDGFDTEEKAWSAAVDFAARMAKIGIGRGPDNSFNGEPFYGRAG